MNGDEEPRILIPGNLQGDNIAGPVERAQLLCESRMRRSRGLTRC